MKKVNAIGLVLSLSLLNGCGLIPFDDSIYKGIPLGVAMQGADGSLTWSDGLKYRGQTVNSIPQGRGEFWFPNGDHYLGEVKDSRMSGEGVFTLADGRIFRGNFVMDRPSGSGVLTLPNGVVHEGTFKTLDDFTGTLTNAEGTYSGSFIKGKRDGVLIFKQKGQSLDRYQRWSQDTLSYDAPGPEAMAAADARCKLTDRDWVLIKGDCNNSGKASGEGEAISRDYSKSAIGQFTDGAFTNGVYRSASGVEYKGEFYALKPNGKAKEIIGGKPTYDGQWEMGVRHGNGICLETGKPQRCEYHFGNRVDAGYLSQLLKMELDALQTHYENEINRIKKDTENAKSYWEKEYRDQMRYIEDEMESAKNSAAVKSLGLGMMMGAAGNMDGARAHMEEQERIYQERKRELENMKSDFPREQREAQAKFASQQRQDLADLERDHSNKLSRLLSEKRQTCEALPARIWDAASNTCGR